ncbi:MAG: hypothetical protein ACJ79A_06730 [Gemmatimonadaceae bacterium]
MTGLWEARFDFVPPNDSLFLAVTQDGATVKGYGFLRQPANTPAGVPIYYYYVAFPVDGTVSGGTADLGLALGPQIQGFGPRFSRLSGRLKDGQLVGVLQYTDSNEYSMTLRHSRPATTDVAGTWVLSSTTGGPPNATADTIIATADGRAWQHREGPLLGGGGFASTAMWRRSGNWFILHHFIFSDREDSLLVTSSELQRPYGVTTEHFARISTAAVLP